MFTGLVEVEGTLLRREIHGRDARLAIRGAFSIRPGDELRLGESISVDGVCLTVDRLEGDTFEVDASSETLAKTTLGALPVGAVVNLERAMPLGGRMGGHLVTGHVDGVGQVVEITTVDAMWKVVVEAPRELARFVAAKGSIAIAGVSLTVNGVAGSRFDVMLIPHTREKTSFGGLREGAKVNLEVDLMARYVSRLFEAESGSDAAWMERLRVGGFL